MRRVSVGDKFKTNECEAYSDGGFHGLLYKLELISNWVCINCRGCALFGQTRRRRRRGRSSHNNTNSKLRLRWAFAWLYYCDGDYGYYCCLRSAFHHSSSYCSSWITRRSSAFGGVELGSQITSIILIASHFSADLLFSHLFD